MKIFLGILCLCILIIFFLNNRTGWIKKNNMYLGVTLPDKQINNPEVLKIVKGYKKATILFFCLMAYVYMPILFMDKLMIQLFIFFLGIAMFIGLGNMLVRIYSNRLLDLKKKKNWKVINRNAVQNPVDNDDYWKHGIYNNPDDENLMVNKRIGYGKTINRGHKNGKLLSCGSYLFTLAIIIIFLFLIISVFELKLPWIS